MVKFWPVADSAEAMLRVAEPVDPGPSVTIRGLRVMLIGLKVKLPPKMTRELNVNVTLPLNPSRLVS